MSSVRRFRFDWSLLVASASPSPSLGRSPTPPESSSRWTFVAGGRATTTRAPPTSSKTLSCIRSAIPGCGCGSAELPAEILRFGVEFSDGRKATTVGGHPAWEIDEANGEGEPPQPVLSERSGGGSDGSWEQEFWLWPLPPPGPFAFVAEWLSEEIELTRREVDASVFLDPAQDSELLWPEQDSAGSPDGNDP
jgi:hypothetical protein